MYLFLLFLLPLAFTLYCFWNRDKDVVPVIVIGIIVAVIQCLALLIFTFAHRVVPLSFGSNYKFFVLRESVAPVILLYGLFFAISRDTVQFKIKSFFPLMIGYYMIYLPYSIIAAAEPVAPGFIAFVKPVIFLAMIGIQSLALNYSVRMYKIRKIWALALCLLGFLAVLALPALIETLYLIGFNFNVVVFVTVVFCIIPVALTGLEIFLQIKEGSSKLIAVA